MIFERLRAVIGNLYRLQQDLPEISIEPPKLDPFLDWDPIVARAILWKYSPGEVFSTSDVSEFHEISGKYSPPSGNLRREAPQMYGVVHSSMRSLALKGALKYRINFREWPGDDPEIYHIEDGMLLVDIAREKAKPNL